MDPWNRPPGPRGVTDPTVPPDRRPDRSGGDATDRRDGAANGRRRATRRGVLALTSTVVAGGLGGCLTLDPSVSTSGVDDSAIFESISVGEPWATNRVRTNVTLTPAATTEHGVRRIAVIRGNGTAFTAASVESGQTKVTLYVPAGGTATLSATNASGGTVDQLSIETGGNAIP